MQEPSDPRPLRTANQPRLVVIVPVLAAVGGIILLASKLSGRFRAIEEPPGRDYPPVPSRDSGPTGQPIKWVGGLGGAPAGSTRTNAATNVGTAVVSIEPTRSNAPKPNAADAVTSLPDSPPTARPRPANPLVSGVTSSAALLADGIVGTVLLRGTPPREKEIPMDPACGALHPGMKPRTRLFMVGTNGGLADVFVVLRSLSPLPGEPPDSPVEIRQRGCEYLPYVTAAQVGQIVRVFNDDPLMHNVHATPTVDGNQERNLAQLPRGAPLHFAFPKPEMFLRFKCDVHPWMFAYVSVVEHPFFAVSGADGQFALPEPPPGDYAVRLYHRKAGEKLVPVKVQRGQRLVLNVTLDITDTARSEATTSGQ
jgi:plastocyanin